jgi:hypothetical protein
MEGENVCDNNNFERAHTKNVCDNNNLERAHTKKVCANNNFERAHTERNGAANEKVYTRQFFDPSTNEIFKTREREVGQEILFNVLREREHKRKGEPFLYDYPTETEGLGKIISMQNSRESENGAREKSSENKNTAELSGISLENKNTAELSGGFSKIKTGAELSGNVEAERQRVRTDEYVPFNNFSKMHTNHVQLRTYGKDKESPERQQGNWIAKEQENRLSSSTSEARNSHSHRPFGRSHYNSTEYYSNHPGYMVNQPIYNPNFNGTNSNNTSYPHEAQHHSDYHENLNAAYVSMPAKIKTHRQETFDRDEYGPECYNDPHRRKCEPAVPPMNHLQSHIGSYGPPATHTVKYPVIRNKDISTVPPPYYLRIIGVIS